MGADGSPFYVTTPIYYVNDVPHIGHAYTTVAGDVLTRWRRLLRRRRLLPHRHRRARPQGPAGGRGEGRRRPQELVDETAGAFRDDVGRCSTSPTTTSSARPSRATTRRCRSSCSAIYDAGDIELGTYEGLYCVSCEAYYTEDELVDGNCPIHDRPVEHVTEENYFFKLSRYEDRLLEHYAAHPEAVQPESRRNEVLGFIRGGLQDFSMSRTSITWGVPLPWDPKHVAYVWADALFNYCTAVGYGDRPASASTKWWPVDYHLVGKDILRFHAVYWPAMLMSAGLDAAEVRVRARLAARRRREDEKTQAQPDRAGRSRRRLRRRRLPLPLHGRPALRPRRRLLATRRWSQRYNADLANNFGNLANRVLNMAVNYCGGVVPDDARRRSARRRGGDRVRRHGRRDGRGSTSRRRSARCGT